MTPIPGQDCTEITPSFRVKGYYFRIDWFDVGVDVLGILGDIGFGTGTPPGIALEVIATGIEIIAFSRHLDTMDLGDPFAATDSIVDILGFIIDGAKIPPGWGILASITDLGTNFIPIPIFKYPESTVSDINQGFTNDK